MRASWTGGARRRCTRAWPPTSRTGRLQRSDLVHGAKVAPLIVVLDGVEDPHNFGAIVRVADAAGVDGIVRQARHSASLDGAAVRASAGAIAHVKIATVVNIARALDELKEAGVWTVGLAGEAEQRYSGLDLRLPTALVVGAEGSGLRRLVRERCDILASIPCRAMSTASTSAWRRVSFCSKRSGSARRPARSLVDKCGDDLSRDAVPGGQNRPRMAAIVAVVRLGVRIVTGPQPREIRL